MAAHAHKHYGADTVFKGSVPQPNADPVTATNSTRLRASVGNVLCLIILFLSDRCPCPESYLTLDKPVCRRRARSALDSRDIAGLPACRRDPFPADPLPPWRIRHRETRSAQRVAPTNVNTVMPYSQSMTTFVKPMMLNVTKK